MAGVNRLVLALSCLGVHSRVRPGGASIRNCCVLPACSESTYIVLRCWLWWLYSYLVYFEIHVFHKVILALIDVAVVQVVTEVCSISFAMFQV